MEPEMRRNTKQSDQKEARIVGGASTRRGQQGLTLIEAMIALLITITGLVSLAGLFTIAMKTNASSRNMTTATVLAQDKLETLGTVSFARLVDPAKMVSNPTSHGPDDA